MPESREERQALSIRARHRLTSAVTLGFGTLLVVGSVISLLVAAPGTSSRNPRADRQAALERAATSSTTRPSGASTTLARIEELPRRASIAPAAVATRRVGVDLEAGEQLRVLFVGDSIAWTFNASVATAAVELTNRGIPTVVTGTLTQPGWGLSADFDGRLVWDGAGEDAKVPPKELFSGWPYVVANAVDTDKPHVVIVLVGAWDAIPRSVDGRWLEPGDPAWYAWLTARIDATNQLITSDGATALWLTNPCIESTQQSLRLASVNRAIQSAAALRPGIEVAALDKLSCPNGEFTSELPDSAGAPVRVRLDDGVHFDALGMAGVAGPWLADQLLGLINVAT